MQYYFWNLYDLDVTKRQFLQCHRYLYLIHAIMELICRFVHIKAPFYMTPTLDLVVEMIHVISIDAQM